MFISLATPTHSLHFGTTKKDIKNFRQAIADILTENSINVQKLLLVFCFFDEKKISLKLTNYMFSF